MVKMGYGEKEDPEYLEAQGKLDNADPEKISQTARSRGRDQLGTMGAGNHFVEVQRVDEIFDKEAAQALGLFKGQVAVMIHTGSRGLGHQVATDYIRVMMRAMPKYGIELPDRELACVPFNTLEGQDYFDAMASAANFAWANRQLITWEVRKAWEEILGPGGGKLEIVYDVSHNMAKLEYYPLTAVDSTLTAADTELLYKDLTYKIRGAVFEVRKHLGLGHKEKVYQGALENEFKKLGLFYEKEKQIGVMYNGEKVGVYQPDFIVENKVLLEIKALPFIGKKEEEQVWHYLCGTPYRLLLLVNFGRISADIKRIVYDSARVAGPQLSAVLVHRKGATRAFGPGHPEIPEKYKEVGQPVLIPGSMGTASYVLVGTNQAMEETFGSSCHGSGRRLSRHAAKRQVHGATLRDQLEKQGIVIRAGSMSGLAEEAPVAYKDVEDVVDVVHQAGIAKKVARLKPLAVVKG